jgi:hypothetical protein
MGKRIGLSRHAYDRIAERGADEDFVRKVAYGQVKRSRLNSNRPNCVILTAWDGNGAAWSLIVNIINNTVVTVREANEKEKENYAQKYQTP